VITICYIHNGSVELLLDEFIGHKSLLENSIFSSYICGSLPVKSLKLVVFSSKHLLLLAMSFELQLQVLYLLKVIFVQMRHTLQFIRPAKHGQLQPANFFITLLLKLSEFDQ